MLNSVVKISVMSAKYFEYYTIILRGAVFSWTHCSALVDCALRWEWDSFIEDHSRCWKHAFDADRWSASDESDSPLALVLKTLRVPPED